MSKVLFGSSLGFVVLPLLLIAQTPSSGPVYVSFNEYGRVTGEADAEFKSLTRVATFGNRSVFMIRRDPGASVPEIHRQMAHILMVVSGEGTLVLGGELVGRHQDPNSGDRENGTTIRNGVEHQVVPGDAFYVPPETPHQYVVQPGKEMTILTINE